jgi:hypothetical protein
VSTYIDNDLLLWGEHRVGPGEAEDVERTVLPNLDVRYGAQTGRARYVRVRRLRFHPGRRTRSGSSSDLRCTHWRLHMYLPLHLLLRLLLRLRLSFRRRRWRAVASRRSSWPGTAIRPGRSL